MNNKMNSLLNNRSLFKICYFIFLSLNMIQYFNITILSRILLGFFLLWGVYITLEEMIVKRGRIYFHINIKFLVGMLFLCMISYIYNWKNHGAYNLFALIFFGFCILVLLVNEQRTDMGLKEMIAIAKMYTLLSIFASSICINMFLNQMQFTILGRSGAEMRIGVWENRLFGIFSSPNVGGTFFVIGIYLTLFLLQNTNRIKRVNRIWIYVGYLNLFLSAWYIVLSLSRGTYVAFFISLTICFVLYKIPRYSRQKFKNRFVKKVIAYLFLLALIGLFSQAVRSLSQNIASSRTEQNVLFERIEYADPVSESGGEEGSEEQKADPSNKRFSIWQASIKIALKTSLTGVGNSYYKLQNMKPGEQAFLSDYDKAMINFSGGNIHNGYLQIFVCCGWLALLLYMMFLFSAFFKMLMSFPKIKNLYIRNSCVLSFAIVVYILVNNIFETNMALMGANSFQAAMWIFSGYVLLFCNTGKKEVSL